MSKIVMNQLKCFALLCFFLLISSMIYCQQSEYYAKARDAYLEAASKSCPERAKVLREYASWCQCMVDVLAGKRSSCGDKPVTPVPSCDGNTGQRAPANSGSNTYNQGDNSDMEDALNGVASGISELSKLQVEKNAKSNDWYILSGGINLAGSSGPIAGTSSDIGQLDGYYFAASALSRKGLSVLASFNSLKSNYFHSFRAKGNDGQSRQYIGRTSIEMPDLSFSLGKDLTGPSGNFHFVPHAGINLIFNLENYFTSTNFEEVEYAEEWKNDMFFAIHGGVQMVYLFTKRFGLQGGFKYLYFPSESGEVFKTNAFFYMNVGIAFRAF